MYKLLTYILITILGTTTLYAKTLRIGVLLTPKQRSAYEKLLDDFTKETLIKGKLIVKSDAMYKKQMPVWLLKGKDTPDVLYWQASQRLFYYVKQGVIQPITSLWKEENLDQSLSHVKYSVTYNGDVYAIPFSYYNWGLFYKKSLMQKYGPLPTDWNSFIVLCRKLKKNQITPIVIGSKNKWPVAAWFDYIDLRINGLSFHRKVLIGSIPFSDPRIKQVFIYWKMLIDADFFNKDSSLKDWDDVVPEIYRNYAGFTLMGNFLTSNLSKKVIDDIGFLPFPRINMSIPLYEEAPMDVFMIAKDSHMRKEAEAFLKYIARADVQSEHNQRLGYLPPNKAAYVGSDYFIQAGAELLKKSKGVSQYFDRDTLPAFEVKAMPILAKFLDTGDIDWVAEQLENARNEVFIQNKF